MRRITVQLIAVVGLSLILHGCSTAVREPVTGVRRHLIGSVSSGIGKHPFVATGRESGTMTIRWEAEQRSETGRWSEVDANTARFTSDDGQVTRLLRYEEFDPLNGGPQVSEITEPAARTGDTSPPAK